MKKTFSNFRTLAALLMAGAAFAACSSDDNIIENQQPANPGEQVYTLTINASKGDATTRALDLDGTGKLTASWANGDELGVINLTKSYTPLSGTLTASNASGSTATFSGTLSGTIDVGDQLILNYQEYNYFGSEFKSQDGTLKGTNGAEKYDAANAIVTVASVDGSGNITISESAASFKTWTAMLKLTLQDGSSNPLNATSLTISVDGIGELLAFSPTAATYTANGDGILYFAMPSAENVAYIKLGADPSNIDEKKAAVEAATVTFTATVGGTTYTATKPGYKFAEGKYYATTLTMAEAGPTAYTLAESTVGMIVASDGKAYAAADKDNLPTGVTAVAIVAYKGSATGEASPYNHGLAIAMKDAAAGGTVKWSSSDNDESLDNYTDYSPAVTTAQSGLSDSQTSGFDNESNYPAFYAALHNTITVSDGISAAAPASGTSGWFLPSLYQWNKIVQGLSGKTADLSHGGNANANYTASSLNPKIEAAGGTGLQSGAYWPSTEYSSTSAWYFYTGNGSVGYRNKTGESRVRAVFAF